MKLKTLLTENLISYSAIVLDPASMSELKKEFESLMPDGWEWIGHHVTIKLGELNKEDKQRLKAFAVAIPIAFGKSDKAMAVKVNVSESIRNIMVGPAFPHITLAVNRAGGGKPVDSNRIIDWTPMEKHLPLSGTIQEIPKK